MPVLRLRLGGRNNVAADRHVWFRVASHVPTKRASTLGVEVDAKAGAFGAIGLRKPAVMAAWFKHRAQLCCSHIPSAARLSAAGAASFFGAEEWPPSTEVWAMCKTSDGRQFRVLTPGHIAG